MGRNRNKGAGGGAGAVAEPAYSSASIPKGWNPADGDVGISKDVNGLRVSIVPQGFERRGGRAYYSLELAGDENAPRFNIVLSQNTEDTWDQLTTRAKPVVDLLKDVTSDENSDFTILPDGSFMIVNYDDDVRLDVYPDGTWNSNNFEIDSDGTTYNAGGRRGQNTNPLEGLRQGLENYGEMVEGKFLSRAGIAQNVENIVGGSDEPAYSSTNIPSGWTPADGDVGISRTFGDRTFNIIPNGFERPGGKPYYSVEITDARGNRIGNPTVISRNPEASWQELTNIINTVTGGVVRNYESYANRTLSSRKEIIDDLKRQHAKIRQEYNRVAQGRLNRPAINRVLAKEREVVQQLRDIRENIASELKTASARARREATGRLSPSVQRLLNHQEGLRAQLRAIPRWATKLPASENALGNSANPGPYAVPLPSNRNIPL